jgi:hypothetical protein
MTVVVRNSTENQSTVSKGREEQAYPGWRSDVASFKKMDGKGGIF